MELSYINQYKSLILPRHYIRNAIAANHWYDFYANRLASYVKKYQHDFCLIINGSETANDAYILPYSHFKGFFTEDYLDHRKRWVGTIKGNRIKLTSPAKPTKYLSVGSYYNAFPLLASDQLHGETAPHDQDVVITDHNEILLSDLQRLIQKFNIQFSNVAPEKRIIISESVARPNAITDYLKDILKHTCQICCVRGFQQRNGSLYIEAHHIIELHELIPGSYCSDNIITVCPTCHKKLHYASISYIPQDDRTVTLIINGDKFSFQRNIIS